MEIYFPPKGAITFNVDASIAPNERTDRTVITVWLSRQRSEHTRRGYAQRAQLLLAALGYRGLRGAQYEHLATFILDACTGRSRATVSAYTHTVQSLFRFCHQLGYIDHNPAVLLRPPVVTRRVDKKTFSQEQIAACFVFAGPFDRALLALLYDAALRIEEACGLLWGDVAVEGERVRLAVHGKGEKLRHVLGTRRLAEALTVLVGFRALGRLDSGDRVLGLSQSGAWRRVKALLVRAGIEGGSPHWFRHSHATHAARNGAPVAVIKDTLGHASLATTSIYIHTTPEESSASYLEE